MKHRLAKTIPTHERERAEVLHKVFCRIRDHKDRQVSKMKAFERVSRYWNGRKFKSNPRQRYRLNAASVYRLWQAWKRGGEIPAALLHRYHSGRRYITAPMLIRFVHFLLNHEFSSLKAAWRAFCQQGSDTGLDGKPLRLGYHALLWNLPRGCYREINQQQRRQRLARLALMKLRKFYVETIAAKVPAQAKGFPTFEI